jgi:hypothetical protein
MGCSIGGAHDPSVADYRATSPRCAQGGKPSASYQCRRLRPIAIATAA